MIFSLKVFVLALLGLDMSSDEEEDLLCPEIMEDSEEDELCNEVMDRFERQRAFQSQLIQQSGIDPQTPVGTFEFDLDPFVDRTSATMGVRERHFTTRLHQTGNFVDSPHVVRALQDGLRRAVDRVLTTTPDHHDQDRLYFTLSSNRLTSNFQGWGLRAGDWRDGGARLDALLDRLAQALNSNEQFEMDDSFQLSMTQVHHAPHGSGKHPRRLTPGNQFPKLFKRNKQTVIRIQNNDDLCCARALVTAKAIVDHHPKYSSFKKGRELQKKAALDLHTEVGLLPPGPCGYEELVKFSAAPSLYEYQIILVDADRAYHVKSFGSTQPKQLILLQEKGHYDVITSLPGFVNKGYVCATCFQTYSNEGRHGCTKKVECRACCQKECPDFLHAYLRGLKATRRCHDCGRDFFGDTCYKAHCTKTRDGKTAQAHQETVCYLQRRCVGCFKLEVGFKDILRHRCGYVDCPSCHKYVNAQIHRCYIQRALTPQEIQEQKKERKRKRQRQGGPPTKRGAAAGLQTLRANEEGDHNDEEEEEDAHPCTCSSTSKPCNPKNNTWPI